MVGDRRQRIFGTEPLQLNARLLQFRRPGFEHALELTRLGEEALTTGIGPDAERCQRADQCRNDRQPVLHSSLHLSTLSLTVGHSNLPSIPVTV